MCLACNRRYANLLEPMQASLQQHGVKTFLKSYFKKIALIKGRVKYIVNWCCSLESFEWFDYSAHLNLFQNNLFENTYTYNFCSILVIFWCLSKNRLKVTQLPKSAIHDNRRWLVFNLDLQIFIHMFVFGFIITVQFYK